VAQATRLGYHSREIIQPAGSYNVNTGPAVYEWVK